MEETKVWAARKVPLPERAMWWQMNEVCFAAKPGVMVRVWSGHAVSGLVSGEKSELLGTRCGMNALVGQRQLLLLNVMQQKRSWKPARVGSRGSWLHQWAALEREIRKDMGMRHWVQHQWPTKIGIVRLRKRVCHMAQDMAVRRECTSLARTDEVLQAGARLKHWVDVIDKSQDLCTGNKVGNRATVVRIQGKIKQLQKKLAAGSCYRHVELSSAPPFARG